MIDNKKVEAMVVLISTALVLTGITAVWAINHDPYPQSTRDCPPGHVYIDSGETPQSGCWPEGAARELGVWPQ